MACGCQKQQGKPSPPDTVIIMGDMYVRVQAPPAPPPPPAPRTGPGRRIEGSEMLREPLLAVSETLVMEGVDEPMLESNVYACGECCEDSGASPAAIRFDTYKKNPLEAVYERLPGTLHELPKKLQDTYAKRVHSCIPFVRVTRDPALFRKCLASARALGRLDDSEKAYKLVGEHLKSEEQEVFLVILVDVQLQVLGVSEIARGGRDSVNIPVPDVLRISIIEGATGMIVAHNHPSGILVPSEADKLLTKTLKEAAESVKLQLLDHLIVGVNGYYSFSKHGLL
jgi:hypothetical protein